MPGRHSTSHSHPAPFRGAGTAHRPSGNRSRTAQKPPDADRASGGSLLAGRRRRYRLILRPDTLEQITWRGRTVISLRNTTAEIRIPAGIRAARTAHLPCLCLRREGQVVFSLPTYTLRSRDQRTMAEFFRRSTDLPLRHISFLT